MAQPHQRLGQHDRAIRTVILADRHIVGHRGARHDPDMTRSLVQYAGGHQHERLVMHRARQIVQRRLQSARQRPALQLHTLQPVDILTGEQHAGFLLVA